METAASRLTAVPAFLSNLSSVFFPEKLEEHIFLGMGES
jgi:hypothetical protein